jgi:hypothetical protein
MHRTQVERTRRYRTKKKSGQPPVVNNHDVSPVVLPVVSSDEEGRATCAGCLEFGWRHACAIHD